ncbi:MAG TPA: M13 family metallopeptidase [Steroidobacteraceae bacterium]|nr:M13 family metallopeptidase [Steroidobacteraceae bacterium]
MSDRFRGRKVAGFSAAAGLLAMVAPGAGPSAAEPQASAPSGLVSGIDTEYLSPSTRPQDDLYRYLNGKWLDEFKLPPDKGTYVSFTAVRDRTQEQLRTLVDELSRGGETGSADTRKLSDLYASFLDEPRLETLGLKPLRDVFSAIDALSSKRQIPALIARFNRTGMGAPMDFDVDPDARDSTRYAVHIMQSGLGLPDRDYYLKDDPKLKAIRVKYLAHIETMLGMAGDRHAHRSAAAILDLETKIAEKQWTRVENRDPIKTYNKTALAELPKLMPGFDWTAYLDHSRLAGRTDYAIVSQPSYLKALAQLIDETPLETWRSYFKWHALSAAAPYLSKRFVDERFAFTGTVLRDVPENEPRWKRGISLLDGSMGEALGRLYVQKYFPPENKSRMEALVDHLIEAYRRDIDRLDWMSEPTKKGAREKLDKLVKKIGYPDKWRDYSTLVISRSDLWGNVVRATEFEYRRDIDKLGKPVDRSEWQMTPQTVNAYYNPLMNEIVFPAAILQPPFFNAKADDAVNYGGIGAVIGHEISHGFDDQGSQYDADGNLRDWFTPEDHAKFAAKTKALVAQYDAYEAVPGFHVNGQLTLGENIADNSGLSIAYQAYHLSLGGKSAPVIDGFTGNQRFFLGWTEVWRGKVREAEAIQRVKTDPHSPPAVRGVAPVRNQPGFYQAFGVEPGDKMYLTPAERVTIW